MTLLRDITPSKVIKALSGNGLALALGLFKVRVTASSRRLAGVLFEHLEACYGGAFCELDNAALADFTVQIRHPSLLRRLWRPQVLGTPDTDFTVLPLPIAQTALAFEMGLNFQIALGYFGHIILHAAVVDFGGKAVVMPAGSGAGKSTLSLVLMAEGGRLLSDEFGLLDRQTSTFASHPRPVSLKNEGIKAAQRLIGVKAVTRPMGDTPKGYIAYHPPRDSDFQEAKRVSNPSLIIFPQFMRGAGPAINTVSPPDAASRLIASSTNYGLSGELGFQAIQRLVQTVPAFEISYGSTEQAARIMRQLLDDEGVAHVA